MSKIFLNFALFCSILLINSLSILAGDPEYVGQFDSTMVAKTEDTEQVVFKLAKGLKGDKTFSDTAHVTTGRLYNPDRKSVV